MFLFLYLALKVIDKIKILISKFSGNKLFQSYADSPENKKKMKNKTQVIS